MQSLIPGARAFFTFYILIESLMNIVDVTLKDIISDIKLGNLKL